MSAKQKNSQPRRIDVHHHIVPPDYVAALGSIGITKTLQVDFPKWSPGKALATMDKKGIGAAITSVSAPGVYFKDDSFSRDLARSCNTYAARLISDYPDRFGGYASLPLPDLDGALHEMEHALDTLGFDGVVLMTNTGGHYIGSPDSEELFAELNRRNAVVFLHPCDLPGEKGEYALLEPLFETGVETTRAVAHLMQTGILERYPAIRYILPHGGGSVPYLAWRMATGRSNQGNGSICDRGLYDYPVNRNDLGAGVALLEQMYYDTSQQGSALLKAVQELASPSHILFGTDLPFQSPIQVSLLTKALTDYDGFDSRTLAGVEREHALALFPP